MDFSAQWHWIRMVGLPIALLASALLFGYIGRRFSLYLIDRWLRARNIPLGSRPLSDIFGFFLTVTITATLVLLSADSLSLAPATKGVWVHAARLGLIAGITGFIVRVFFFAEAALNRYAIAEGDNLRQRRMRTQIQFIVRLASVLIVLVGVSLALMTFHAARQIGASLIASAGLASVVIGFAAQKSLSNLIAGFQIAFTQPIRIDDVVIVEKEWGRVEEITLTYVVVKIWDLRRLVLPITYFLEKPFENWTRNSADILGTIFLYLDYSVPVEPLRQELSAIVKRSPLWDGKVCILQVTEATEQTVQLRGLMSSRNAADAFDLRCFAREELLAFIQKNFPNSLPRVRAELTPDTRALSGNRSAPKTSDPSLTPSVQ